jgi:hypothetical protein
MSIPVLCPHCLHTDRAAAGMAGHRVRCPECDQRFLVVALDQAEPNPAPVPSLAFLDEEEGEGPNEERRSALLTQPSVATESETETPAAPEIPPGPQIAPIVSPRASQVAIYVGMGIGGIFAIFLGAAIFLFLRSGSGDSAMVTAVQAEGGVVVKDHGR